MSTSAPTIGYIPQPMQQVFHTAPADEVLFGGSAGGGKSESLLNELIWQCLEKPKTRAIVFRRTSPELQELRDRASELLHGQKGITYNGSEDRWAFPNGSFLRFSHLQFLDDVRKHQGAQYTIIAFDEATHFMPEQVNYLRSRNRSPEDGAWSRMLFASNPGSVGHVYFKSYFVEPRDEYNNLIEDATLLYRYDFTKERWQRLPKGTRGRPEPYVVWLPDLTPLEREINKQRVADGAKPIVPLTRVFIPARLRDNKYLYEDPSYHAKLARLPEQERRALMDGNWDIFEGQFFAGFSEHLHVIEPFTPPDHWRKWRALDWGWTDPLCVLWLTQDPETRQIVVYRELYGSKIRDSDAIHLVKTLTQQEHIDFTVADPSMWRGDSNDHSLSRADIYQQAGILLHKASNDRVAGWSRVRDLLGVNPETGKPGLVITRDCHNLIRTLPQAVHDEDRVEDVDPDGEDHALDALRYACMASLPSHNRIKVRAGRFGRW